MACSLQSLHLPRLHPLNTSEPPFLRATPSQNGRGRWTSPNQMESKRKTRKRYSWQTSNTVRKHSQIRGDEPDVLFFRWSIRLLHTHHLMERKRTRRTWRTGSTLVRSPPAASRSSFSPKTAKKKFFCKSRL